jgi:hypothetical protein
MILEFKNINFVSGLSWRQNGTTWLFPPFFPVSSPNLEEEESGVAAPLLPRCYSELPARRNPRDWLTLRSRLLLLADSGGGPAAVKHGDDLEPVLPPANQETSEPDNRYKDDTKFNNQFLTLALYILF